MTETIAALAGSLVLAGSCALAPAVARLPEGRLASLDSFCGGTGLAYVSLYLLFDLARHGAPKIHALLPLGAEPLETLFVLLLVALATMYLLQVHLAESPSLHDDFVGYATLFLAYNFLAGAAVLEEAHTGLANLGFYVIALGLHLLFNDLFLLRLCPTAHHWRWRAALAAMPIIGCAMATAFALPEGVLYGMLTLIAGSTVITVVRHELPSPGNFRPAAFSTGVVVYAGLIVATWRL